MGDLLRPPPRRSSIDHAVAVIRWVGAGRLVAVAASVLAVAAGAFFLLRAPELGTSDGERPAVSVAAPTLPPGADRPAAGGADPTTTSSAAPSTTASRVVVHVAGAVASPGVHDLAAGSRIGDAVAAAGGPAPGAVLDAVNLAAPLTDGQQVYVPHAGEAAGPAPPAGPGAAPPGTVAPHGPLDLNTATEDELLALPGVGPVLAAAIVRHRDEAGPFTSVDGLLDVSGIGPARLASLRDLVRV